MALITTTAAGLALTATGKIVAGALAGSILSAGFSLVDTYVLQDTPGLKDPSRDQDFSQDVPAVPRAYNICWARPIIFLSRDADPDRSRYADLWLVYGLFEGTADRVEKVFYDGSEVDYARSVTPHGSGHILKGTGSDWGPDGNSRNVGNWPKFQFYEIFDGDGVYTLPEFSYQDRVGGLFPQGQPPWEWNTSTHSFKDIAGGLLIGREKVGKIKDPNPPRKRAWESYPSPQKMIFQVSGCTPVIYPRGTPATLITTPEVTGSPAALCFDFVHKRLGVPMHSICFDCVAASHTVCEQDVVYTESQLDDEHVKKGFTRSTKRYRAGGIWTDAADQVDVLRQLSDAMAGKVVRGLDGKVHIIAGAPDAGPGARLTINEGEILGDPFPGWEESFGGPIEQNKNTFRLTLAHSAQDRGQPVELPKFIDDEAVARDGSPVRGPDGSIQYDEDGNPVNKGTTFELNFGSNLFLYDELIATRVLRRMGLEKSRLTHTISFSLPKYVVDQDGQLSKKYMALTPYKTHVNLVAPTRGYPDLPPPKPGAPDPNHFIVTETSLERTPRTSTEPARSWIRVTLAKYDTGIDIDDLNSIPPLHPAKLDPGLFSGVPSPKNVLLAQIPGTRYAKITFDEVPVAVAYSQLAWRAKVTEGDAERDWLVIDNIGYGDEIDFGSVIGPATIQYYLTHVGYDGAFSEPSVIQEMALKDHQNLNGNVPSNRCPPTGEGEVGDWYYATDGRVWAKDRGPWEEALQTTGAGGSGVIARGINLQGSGTVFLRPTDTVHLSIPSWALENIDVDKNIYRMRKRTDGKFELAVGDGHSTDDFIARLESELVVAFRAAGEAATTLTQVGLPDPDKNDPYRFNLPAAATPPSTLTAAGLTAWFTARGTGNWNYDVVLLDGGQRCPHDPLSPWRPLFGDSSTSQPRPGGYNFSINLAKFETSVAAVNAAGDWYGTGLMNEEWPLTTTLSAYISSASDVQALMNLPEGARVVMEQTPFRFAIGTVGVITRAGKLVTIPITFTERHNFALFKAGHNAQLSFTLSDPNLRNPSDKFTLNRYDPALNVNAEWNMAFRAGSEGARTWDQVATLKAYITSASTKAELGRLGADGEDVYITVRDMEKHTANWADLRVATPISIANNTVTFTVEGVHNAVGEPPPQNTGDYEIQVSYLRLDLTGWAGFNRAAALGAYREREDQLENNRDWTLLDGGGSHTWEKSRWPTTAQLAIRISGISDSEDAVLVKNLRRLRKGHLVGIRNNGESFAEFEVTSTAEQMDNDYRYGLKLLDGQLRGGPTFSPTESPTLWFMLEEPTPPEWTDVLLWKYHTNNRPEIPGRLGVRFGDAPAILIGKSSTPNRAQQNNEPGWALSSTEAAKPPYRAKADEATHTTLWACYIAVSNISGELTVLSDDWLTQPFKIKTPDTHPAATSGFESEGVLYGAQEPAASVNQAPPAALADTADIPGQYSRIQNKLQREHPGWQLVVFTGRKSGNAVNSYNTANRVFTKGRTLTRPTEASRVFTRYVVGRSGLVVTAADFTGAEAYKFTSPICHFADNRRSRYINGVYVDKRVFLGGDYIYIAVPSWVGPMTKFYWSSTGASSPSAINKNLNYVLPANRNDGYGWVLSPTETPNTIDSINFGRYELIYNTEYKWPRSGKRPKLLWIDGEPHRVFRSRNYFRTGHYITAPFYTQMEFLLEDG